MKSLRKAFGVLLAASLLAAAFCPVPAMAGKHACCSAKAGRSAPRHAAKSACAFNCASPAGFQAVPSPAPLELAALLPASSAAAVPAPALARAFASPPLLYQSPPLLRPRDRSPPAC